MKSGDGGGGIRMRMLVVIERQWWSGAYLPCRHKTMAGRERERNIDSDKKLWQEFLYVHFIQVNSSFLVFKNNWLLLDGWTNGPTDG